MANVMRGTKSSIQVVRRNFVPSPLPRPKFTYHPRAKARAVRLGLRVGWTAAGYIYGVIPECILRWYYEEQGQVFKR